MILVEELSKTYKHALKDPGVMGAIKHLYNAKYKETIAVDKINMTISDGEAVAYLGRNGAGKSTTIKMLSGILMPTSGTIRINGKDPFKQRLEVCKHIGAVFGQRTQLWWDIPIRESFSLLKDIYDIPNTIYEANMDNFRELLELEDYLHLTARKLSLGQRMRADLAAALLHNPQIVYLDEPTIGLDISAKEKIREFIKYINKEKNTTIILTTHDLGDIESICNRLIMIERGQIIYDGDLEVIKERFVTNRTIHFLVANTIINLAQIINQIPGVALQENNGTKFSLKFNRYEVTAGDIVGEIMRFTKVLDIRIDEPNIEQVIKKVYEGEVELEHV